jgi:hypothetical protein
MKPSFFPYEAVFYFHRPELARSEFEPLNPI